MRSRGFTLLEVMISLAILGLALTAIVDINGGAIRMHAYAKQVTVATMLARYKMADLESKFRDEGFTSEFDQKMEGKFDEEGWEDFRWEAEIVVPNLDGKNASGMVEQIVQKMLAGAGAGAGAGAPGGKGDSAAPSDPTVDAAGGLMGTLAPMLEQQVTTLTTLLQKSVREVRLRVIWRGEGKEDDSVDVTTHMVVLAPAGQPGGDSIDPELTAQQPSATTAPGTTPGVPGLPGSPGSSILPGSGGGSTPQRPNWVPSWVPPPQSGAHYNPALQSNPSAPPYIFDTPPHG